MKVNNYRKFGSVKNLIISAGVFFTFVILFLIQLTPVEKKICEGLPENAVILDLEFVYLYSFVHGLHLIFAGTDSIANFAFSAMEPSLTKSKYLCIHSGTMPDNSPISRFNLVIFLRYI